MASVGRRALMSNARSFVSRTKPPLHKPATASPQSSLPSPFSPSSRFVSVLGCVESMMPLHSAIASARLKSRIAVDSTCWSWLSQDFAVPR